jgi:LacI family transcriptional regulator
MVTSRDVARAAGVSQATVSRALSGPGIVSEATRQRVLAAVAEVGYSPNSTARAMRTGRSRTVGIVVADLANPFYPAMLDALGAAFERLGYRVTVWVTTSSANEAALQAIREGSVDGVVFTTATADSTELRGAVDRGSPIVLVNRSLPDVACDQVGSDNEAGAALIARYLVGHGRTRAGFVGGTPAATTSRARLDGFSRAMRELGHPLDPALIVEGEYGYEEGRAGMLRLLDGPPVDAVFCSNDLLALGALDAARGRGVRVPEDLWVVGYDDIAMAAWGSYSLTTVRQDVAATADLAASMLVDRITGGGARAFEHVAFPPELVVRGSTGLAPLAGP